MIGMRIFCLAPGEMELLPDVDDNTTHMLESSFGGKRKIRLPKMKILPNGKQSLAEVKAGQKFAAKKATVTREKKVIDSSVKFDEMTYESGENHERPLGSVMSDSHMNLIPSPDVTTRASPKLMTAPSPAPRIQRAPTALPQRAIQHPSYSPQNSLNSKNTKSPMSKSYANSRMTSNNGSSQNALKASGDFKASSNHPANLSPRSGKCSPPRDSASSLESSMECEFKPVEAACTAEKQGNSAPTQQPDLDILTSLPSMQDEEFDRFRVPGHTHARTDTLYSLPSGEIKFPPPDVTSEVDYELQCQLNSECERKSDALSGFDHEQHALDSLSFQFNYSDERNDDVRSMEESGSSIRNLFPQT